MAQQQIVTKPYVEELLDADSLFVNHDGALRQIKKNKMGFATKEDLEGKVDKETGKGLSTNDYTNAEKSKLADLENYDDAEVRGLITGLQTSKADKTDLTKTDRRLNALYELTQGQAWDFDRDNNNAYSVDVPSGSKYASIDMVGGKSIMWNQLVQNGDFADGKAYWLGYQCACSVDNGVITVTPSASSSRIFQAKDIVLNHKYLMIATFKGTSGNATLSWYGGANKLVALNGNWQEVSLLLDNTYQTASNWQLHYGTSSNGETAPYYIKNAMCFDLTQIFGSTIADYIYSIERSQAGAGVAWFKKLFPDDYYPYSEPTIISSQTDRVDVASADGTITQQIETGFPVLNSAGSVYDYIDLNEGKLHQRVGMVDLGTLDWVYVNTYASFYCISNLPIKRTGSYNIKPNILCAKYETKTQNDIWDHPEVTAISLDANKDRIYINDTSYTDATAFKAAMSGVMLYYELAEEIVTDITIPSELSDWLTVEAGGSITFHNSDEGKRLLIPSTEEYLVKLSEVVSNG